MAWMKIETSVSRNRKFVKAGPGPSWLWVCGIAYCQEGLTDGFIPAEALPFLGVKSAQGLVKHLVSAGLWDVADGGWRVHDYLEHNKPASEVQRIRGERAAGGIKGGRKNLEGKPSVIPSQLPSVIPSVQPYAVPSVIPSLSVAVDDAVDVAVAVADQKTDVGSFPMDVWFERLKAQYPPNRVTSGHLTMTAFCDALLKYPTSPQAAFDRMIGNLENQKRGHEWRVKGLIPKLENWLRSGAWEQVHDEAPASVLLTDRTANTLAAAAAVKRLGR